MLNDFWVRQIKKPADSQIGCQPANCGGYKKEWLTGLPRKPFVSFGRITQKLAVPVP